jgi:hypothetical protein
MISRILFKWLSLDKWRSLNLNRNTSVALSIPRCMRSHFFPPPILLEHRKAIDADLVLNDHFHDVQCIKCHSTSEVYHERMPTLSDNLDFTFTVISLHQIHHFC